MPANHCSGWSITITTILNGCCNSHLKQSQMKLSGYLLVTRATNVREKSTAEWKANTPKITNPARQVFIKIDLEVPDVLFTRPQLYAKVEVPLAHSEKIVADVSEKIEGLIQKETGMKIKIVV